RRPGADPATRREPAVERGQVHHRRADHAEPDAGLARCLHRRRRHRHRHRRGRARAGVRTLLSGAILPEPPPRRHRPGTDPVAAPGRAHGRRDHRAIPDRRRIALHRPAATAYQVDGRTPDTMNTLAFIIDDSAVNIAVARLLLPRLGWTVEPFSSAIPMLERLTQVEPAFMLLDISMPDMGGDGACQLIRSNPA